jgi:hypothetical protein
MDITEKLIRGIVKNKHCPIQPKSDTFMVSQGLRNRPIETPNFRKTLKDRVDEKKIKERFKAFKVKTPK